MEWKSYPIWISNQGSHFLREQLPIHKTTWNQRKITNSLNVRKVSCLDWLGEFSSSGMAILYFHGFIIKHSFPDLIETMQACKTNFQSHVAIWISRIPHPRAKMDIHMTISLEVDCPTWVPIILSISDQYLISNRNGKTIKTGLLATDAKSWQNSAKKNSSCCELANAK